MLSSWKIYLGIGIAFIAMLGFGYWYFTWSQNKISQLAADKAKLEVAVDEQKKTIESMQEFQRRQSADLVRLQNDLSESETEKGRLAGLLARHNLTELARQKPGLIEKRINDASKKMLRELSGGK